MKKKSVFLRVLETRPQKEFVPLVSSRLRGIDHTIVYALN